MPRAFYHVTRPGGYLRISDHHPDAHAAGWRAWFMHEGTRYDVPTHPHMRDGYLRSLTDAGV